MAAMTIVDKQLVSKSGQEGDDGRSYTFVYKVWFTGEFEPGEILVESGLPHRGDTLAYDTSVYCSGGVVSTPPDTIMDAPADMPQIAIYTAEWKPKKYNWDADPLSRPAEISGGGSPITESMTKDWDGVWLLNSAGDSYAQNPEKFIPALSVNISRNEEDNPCIMAAYMSWTSNASAWHGIGAEFGIIQEITFSKKYELVNGSMVQYWEVSYPLKIRTTAALSWRLRLIDNGYKKKVSSSLVVPTDSNGSISYEPVLLDGSGNVLGSTTSPVIYPATGYTQFMLGDWGDLALPDIFA